MAGGVSPALTQLVGESNANHLWWHLDGDTISYSNSNGKKRERHTLSQAVIEGHYRYCNEFIWPLMHDLSEYANYRSEDRALYERFNRILAREIVSSQNQHSDSKLFVQDYQLALLPKELQRLDGPLCGIFWHIPWPKSVPQEFLPALVDLAKSMLTAEFIGFHTTEYCSNFFNFVSRNIPGTRISMRERTVVREVKAFTTTVVAAPLGLDVDHWSNIARGQSNTRLHPALINTDYVLSVDRADYTKGVVPRIESIAHFFNDHPEMIGKITFAQLCTRTRPGIEGFDNNWSEIQRTMRDVNARFSTEDWRPILNLKGPLNASELSLLYRNASMMLVNPVRDGLNLTAKEYVACQSGRPGVLALSPHCGAYEELGAWSVEANPFDPHAMSASVYNGLKMSVGEKKTRMTQLKASLRENTLAVWCEQFRIMLEPQTQHQIKTAIEAAR